MTNLYIAYRHKSTMFWLLKWVLHTFSNQNTPVSIYSENDEILVSNAIHDPQAFEELYRRYVDRVYAYHLIRTNSREEAEDLTSQTFLSALEGISGYRRQGSFAGWLFSIARRKLADHYRRPSMLPLDIVEETGANLEDAIDHKLRLQQVSRALMVIDADRVEALSLRIFGQLSTGEISRILSKSEGAVRNLVYRALLDLRKQLVFDMEMEEK